MSFLAPLLEIQDLDLAADAARERSLTLPERESIPLLASALSEIEAQLAAAREERSGFEGEEEEIGLAVSQLVRDIEAAEVERYSGKRIDRDEAKAHDDSQEKRRAKQSELEEREMALLESIEAVEHRIIEHESARAANREDAAKAEAQIRQVEADVAKAVERLGEERAKIAPQVPDDVLSTYERVRVHPRMRGRGAAQLVDGFCQGCRIKLPSLEKTRMLAKPEDAVITCPQCQRVLVR